MPRGQAPDLKDYINGMVLGGGSGGFNVENEKDWENKVYIGIIHDSSGYTPLGAIYVDEYTSQDGALQEAYEELEETLRKRGELDTTEKEHYQDAIKEGLDEEAAWQRAYEWTREAWDGAAWTMTKREVYEILKGTDAAKHIDMDIDIQPEEVKESSMNRQGDYQGWKNYPTWNFALWMDNDKGTYDYVVDAIRVDQLDVHELADFLAAMAEENMPEVSGTYADIMGWAMKEIDFKEIAEHWLEEYGVKADV